MPERQINFLLVDDLLGDCWEMKVAQTILRAQRLGKDRTMWVCANRSLVGAVQSSDPRAPSLWQHVHRQGRHFSLETENLVVSAFKRLTCLLILFMRRRHREYSPLSTLKHPVIMVSTSTTASCGLAVRGLEPSERAPCSHHVTDGRDVR